MLAVKVHRLGPGDGALFAGMLDLFGTVFDDHGTYGGDRPSRRYLDRLLANPSFVGLVAVSGARVVGALTAYQLPKFERERSEYYIYDLAVATEHRRRGIATELIETTRGIAKARGAWVVMIQAEYGDDSAIALYSKLGSREEILHFDIPVP